MNAFLVIDGKQPSPTQDLTRALDPVEIVHSIVVLLLGYVRIDWVISGGTVEATIRPIVSHLRSNLNPADNHHLMHVVLLHGFIVWDS